MTTEAVPGHHTMAAIIVGNLRAAGWTVAVHNDYRQGGKPHTFWLFTHEATKRFVQGEGPSDQEALEICAHDAAMLTDAPVKMAEPELPGLPHIDLERVRRKLAETDTWLKKAGPPAGGWHKERAPEYTDSGTILLITELRQLLKTSLDVIETRFALPEDPFYDAEEAGDAMRAGLAAFVPLEGYQKLLAVFHSEHHGGSLAACTVEICVEGRQHLPHLVPDDEAGAALAEAALTDHYIQFAAEVYGVPVTGVTPEMRVAAKRATYLMGYGGDVSRSAAILGVPADRVVAAANTVYKMLIPRERL
jgi:hypothetical protein